MMFGDFLRILHLLNRVHKSLFLNFKTLLFLIIYNFDFPSDTKPSENEKFEFLCLEMPLRKIRVFTLLLPIYSMNKK